MTGVGRGGGVKPTRCRVIFNTHRHQQVWEMLPDSSMDLPRSRVSAFRVPVAVDWSIREIPAAIWEGSIVCKTTVITLFKLCHQFRAISKMQRFDKMYLGRSIVAGINPLSTILCSRRSVFAVFSRKDISLFGNCALRAGRRTGPSFNHDTCIITHAPFSILPSIRGDHASPPKRESKLQVKGTVITA